MNHDDVTIEPVRDPGATIRAHANRARLELLRLASDRDRWAEIVELAVERAETIGVAEYGTRAWTKLPPELRVDQNEELADWLFYIGVEFDREVELGTAEPFRCLPSPAELADGGKVTPIRHRRCGACGDHIDGNSVTFADKDGGNGRTYCDWACAQTVELRI